MPTKPRVKSTARAKKTPARKVAARPRARPTPARRAVEVTAAAAGGPRRAVFIDVENTSSEAELGRVLDELDIDLATGRTDVTAIGNWRVVGQQLGRSLAQRGANLVHSAPATRVPDWSDLWIAVQAGMWLGRSQPGDRIDIVSHDRAFDAVGDAAARLGVAFHRITYRSAGASAAAADRGADTPAEHRSGGRRRRRRGGGRSSAGPRATPSTARVAPVSHARVAAKVADEEPQAAPQEQLQQVIARLAASEPSRTISLDALTVALKAAGFQRPPGSPRLVTRLRRMKDVEVLANNRVRLTDDAETVSSAEPAEPPAEATSEAENGAAENGTEVAGTGKRRSRRRGGRRRGGRGRKSGAATPAPPAE